MKIFRLAIATFTLILASAAYAVPVEVTFEGVVGDTDQAIPATPHFEAGFVVTTSREPEAIEGIFGKDSGVVFMHWILPRTYRIHGFYRCFWIHFIDANNACLNQPSSRYTTKLSAQNAWCFRVATSDHNHPAASSLAGY